MQKGKCVHFNGSVNPCCEAGVNYRALVGGQDFGWLKRLPCLVKYAGPDAVTCEKRQEPTAEQIEASKREMEEAIERINKVRAAIVAHLGGPWKKGMEGSSGSIPCPCCSGTVRFSRAGYNGHVHAHCSGADCVSWME
jgi:hypothetical protein